MLDRFPDSVSEGIGRYVLHALELLAAASLTCLVVSAVFGTLAYRSSGGRRAVWIWLAVAAGLLALVPLGVVIYAANL